MLMQKKMWAVLGLVAMGCAANTESVSGGDDSNEQSDSEELSARRHAGTYARFDQSISGCDLSVRLTLRPNGTFVSEGGASGPVFCAAVALPPETGRWSSAGNVITLKQRSRTVATAKVANGKLSFRQVRGQTHFVGTLVKLAAGQCADARDCRADEYCTPPVGLPYCDVIGPDGSCNNPVEPGPGYCTAAPVDPPADGCFSDAECGYGGICIRPEIICDPTSPVPCVQPGGFCSYEGTDAGPPPDVDGGPGPGTDGGAPELCTRSDQCAPGTHCSVPDIICIPGNPCPQVYGQCEPDVYEDGGAAPVSDAGPAPVLDAGRRR